MRLIISYTSSIINQKKEPDNTYLQISSKPAWELLKKWYAVSSDFAHFSFRVACGYTAHPDTKKFNKNSFFVWIDTCSTYNCLICFLRAAERVVVSRDNSPAKRSVMYRSVMTGDTSI